MTATTENNSTTIMPVLSVVDGKITTTSNQVAEHFGKEHKLVLRAIRNLLKELPEKHRCNFAPVMESMTYVDSSGVQHTKNTSRIGHYILTRDAFTLLAMGFTGKEALHWKLAYIDTFNKMEAELLEQMLANRPAIDYERINPAQKQALKELVNAQVHKTGKHHQTVWTEFQTHFRVNKYEFLPATRFDEACKWLGGKRIATKAAPATSYELPAVDFDFMRTMNDGLCDPKPINSAVRAVAQQMSWKLAAEAQVGILQFLERFISYRTNDAMRQDVSCVAPMLEKLTLSHCLAYRFFEELDRARQMAGLMQQMANTCVNSIQQRMGTVFA